jgi:hypothetical protein
VVRALLGIGVTALFVCLAPRFGERPAAALAAGGFAWAFVYAYTAWGHAHIGLFPASLAWALAGGGLIEMVATALVGAWVGTGPRFWK